MKNLKNAQKKEKENRKEKRAEKERERERKIGVCQTTDGRSVALATPALLFLVEFPKHTTGASTTEGVRGTREVKDLAAGCIRAG